MMSLFTSLGILLFSFTGLLFGLALSFIAPEERKPGKKYFILFKWFLFFIIVLLASYYFVINNQFFFVFLSLLLALLIFLLTLKAKNNIFEAIGYLFFSFLYFSQTEQSSHLLFGVIIFLYGFPTGTLLRKIPVI